MYTLLYILFSVLTKSAILNLLIKLPNLGRGMANKTGEYS